MSNSATLPRVLCVDDEAHVLSGLKRQMRTKYNIFTAIGPKDGLETLKTNGPFDVIISDFRMPIMDGAAFLRQAKEIDPAATRILLTGDANMEDVQAAVNEGSIYKVLLKPCSIEELRDAMSGALKKHVEKRAAIEQADELLRSLAP